MTRSQKFGGRGNYTRSVIGLKRHSFNIKHYLHKSYLHKTIENVHFSLHSNNETTQKYIYVYFEKFIKEIGFVDLST